LLTLASFTATVGALTLALAACARSAAAATLAMNIVLLMVRRRGGGTGDCFASRCRGLYRAQAAACPKSSTPRKIQNSKNSKKILKNETTVGPHRRLFGQPCINPHLAALGAPVVTADARL
jgi:hypothetical protein